MVTEDYPKIQIHQLATTNIGLIDLTAHRTFVLLSDSLCAAKAEP